MNATDFLRHFDNVQETGKAQWSAKCPGPGHDDRKNSLCIKAADDGTLLLKCQANCNTQEILNVKGLSFRDLFPPTNGNGHHHAVNGQAKPKIIATYPYQDENGNLLFEVCRFEPKDFRQRRPDGNGGWAWSVSGVRKVVYQLPKLLAAPDEIVFIPEGEKDVDRLAELGILSTTNAGGAGKFRTEHAKFLKGRDVVILPDNDEPGRKHAQQVAKSLNGIARSIKVVELPNLPPKCDINDWLGLAAGGTRDELLRLAEKAPEWEAPKTDHSATQTDESIKRKKSRPIIIAESDHSAKKSVPGLRTENGRTDHANAMRFAELHGGTVRYCHSNGAWYLWDGKKLALDQQGQVDELAKQIGQSMWDWLGPNLPNLEPTEATEILRFVRYTSSTRGIQNLLSLAKSEPTIAVKLDELDANPHYLNCSNGIVDLKAATLLPHHPKHLQTKIATAEFLQGAEGKCPLWVNALDTIFGGDQHLIRFVHRLFGMSLIGEVTEHVLPIFYGLGSNGKSLIVEMILEAVGDYGHKAPADLLLVKKGDCHPTERADLFGRRPVFCTETDAGRKLAEALSKELSGGDKITARWMRQNFFTFKPSHTLILVSNHKPRVSGTDHGLWRRLKLIPFTQRFWNEDAGETGPIELQADKQLKDKLHGELSGILSWMVHGCIDWQQHGLGEPVAVVAATNDYRAAEDILAAFIADCCELAQTCTVSAKELRKCYSEWCAANGEKPVSGRRLSDYIMEMGITKRHSGGTVYNGIKPR